MRMRRAGRVVTYDDGSCERARDKEKRSFHCFLHCYHQMTRLLSTGIACTNWPCRIKVAEAAVRAGPVHSVWAQTNGSLDI